MELEDQLYERIQTLSAEGDAQLEEENYTQAVAEYSEALALVPEPKEEWEAATWLHASIGAAQYEMGAYPEALESLNHAMRCPEGHANPFILLRLGQCHYALHDLKAAREFLLRAYMLEGREIFEDEDPAYFGAIADLATSEINNTRM